MYLLGCLIFLFLPDIFNGQDLICRFYAYNANCRYRLDGASMTVITAIVNKCSDPIDVSFNIKNGNPVVDWSHTFSKNHEVEDVIGFNRDIQLEVSLAYDTKGDLLVKADFYVESMKKAYFLDDKVSIVGTEECLELNKAGHIAVGCLVALLVIAGILLVILLYLRHRRKLLARQNTALVTNIEISSEPPCPVGQPTVRFNAQAHQQASNQNSTTSHVTFLPNGHITNSGRTGLPV